LTTDPEFSSLLLRELPRWRLERVKTMLAESYEQMVEGAFRRVQAEKRR